jgi:hypothetical protein
MPSSCVHIELSDGCLRSRRPEHIRELISVDEWHAMRKDIYEALLPAIQFKRVVIISLIGLFAIPFTSFFCLLVLILAELIAIDGEEEDAFRLLLIIGSCGSLGLGIVFLLIGSLVRRIYIERHMDVDLAKVVYNFERGAGERGIDIDIATEPPCQHIIRRVFVAWYDVDFVLTITPSFECSNASSSCSDRFVIPEVPYRPQVLTPCTAG